MPAARKLTREGKPYRTDYARYATKMYGLKAVRAHVTDAFKVKPGSTLENVLFGLRQAANLTLRYVPMIGLRSIAEAAVLARWARQFDLAWKDAKKDVAALNAVAMAPPPASDAPARPGAARKNTPRRTRRTR